jgi:hypothetical protein
VKKIPTRVSVGWLDARCWMLDARCWFLVGRGTFGLRLALIEDEFE